MLIFNQYVGVNDVVDILATSMLVYYVLLLIRGTRAVQILTGILVLAALLAIATGFHLLLLGAILQLVVLGAAVTLPIVFQPELRRALEHIGRGGFLRIGAPEHQKTRSEDRSIESIAKAAFLLSRSRLGALIVIEQLTGLKDFLESGTALHADLSAELLLAIFLRRSPLHDGAVIIRGNVIEAAACFLPLADASLSEHRLGTRHRAALGLAEQTDAVIVVVSEETGVIAVARGGKLSQPIEDEPRLLRTLLASTRARRQSRETGNDFIEQLRARIASQRQPRKPHADHSAELRT